MKITRLSTLLVGAGLAAAALAPSATADTVSTGSSVSSNWAGYRAETQDGNGFTRVAGSWTEPSADCSTSSGHASFWVGLGGSGANDSESDSLEQAGTAVDCDASGNATHTAWYELLPAAPVQLDLKVSAGDHMSSSVTINGSAVTITVSDSTTGQSTTKNLTMPNQPDVSTAEWIAEAPSHCDNTSGCQPLTLANFGKVSFTNASATASGHTGTISDSAWTSQPITLSPGGGVTDVSASDSSSGGAQPTDLSSDGSSFSVSYIGASSTGTSTGGYDPSASGYGYDPGSGGYGSGGYGSGSGSGSGGDGSGGDGSGGDGSGGYGYDPGSGGYGYGSGGYGDGSGGYGSVGIDPAAAAALLAQY
jgi:hypothetical protein